MSIFNNQKVEVEFIYSSSATPTAHSDPNQYTRHPPPFISGNRSGDYVSQIFHQGYSGRGFTEWFHVSCFSRMWRKGMVS